MDKSTQIDHALQAAAKSQKGVKVIVCCAADRSGSSFVAIIGSCLTLEGHAVRW